MSDMTAIETLSHMDREITKQTLSLCNLSARRNTFLPIFRLPPETLATIFVHGARDHYENMHVLPFCLLRLPRWVNVSYVCRHWRSVALGCSTLWAYPFTLSLRWTEELLARSRQAPLKVRIIYDISRDRLWWSNIIEKWMTQVERIQVLRLDSPWRILPFKLSSYAPRSLQHLAITFPADGARIQSLAPFDGYTPALRTLELLQCTVLWHSLTLNGLTKLSLRHVPRYLRHHIADFLPILSHMQDLTDLYLDQALAGTISNRTFPAIDLPRLSRLWVIAPLSTLIALLNCINIPPKTQARLHFQGEYGPSFDDYAPIPGLLLQRLGVSKSSIRSLFINFSFGQVFGFSTLERDLNPPITYPPMQDNWDCNVPLLCIFDVIHRTIRHYERHVMNDICYSLPLTDVRTLHFIRPPFSSDYWRKMLDYFTNLRCLKLGGGCMPDLAFTLSLTAQPVDHSSGYIADDRGAPNHIVAPALEELELHGIVFLSNQPLIAAPPSALFSILSTRKNLRVTMIDCRDHVPRMNGSTDTDTDTDDSDAS